MFIDSSSQVIRNTCIEDLPMNVRKNVNVKIIVHKARSDASPCLRRAQHDKNSSMSSWASVKSLFFSAKREKKILFGEEMVGCYLIQGYLFFKRKHEAARITNSMSF